MCKINGGTVWINTRSTKRRRAELGYRNGPDIGVLTQNSYELGRFCAYYISAGDSISWDHVGVLIENRAECR